MNFQKRLECFGGDCDLKVAVKEKKKTRKVVVN